MKARTAVLLVFVAVVLFFCITRGSVRQVVINEVAWGGSPSNVAHEWIELLNTTDKEISLEGWRLVSSNGSPDVLLSGSIPVFGFYLLERNDDQAVPGMKADLIYRGALRDGGEILYLLGPDGKTIDTANQEGGSWPAGANGFGVPPHCSMERVDPGCPDVSENWATCQGDDDDEGDGYCGSPRAENSAYNLVPHVEFSVSPSPVSPHELAFFDAGTSSDPNGEIVSFAWNFGDGTTGKGQTASHTYTKIGTYTATLTATDDKGGVEQRTKEVRVVTNDPPIVDFSVKATSPARMLQSLDELEFIDESSDNDGEVVAWTWRFGDGAFAEGQTASHTYDKGGEFIVGLAVTDDQGATAAQTQPIRIANRVPVARFTATPELPNEGQEVLLEASGSTDQDGRVVRYEWDFDGDDLIDLFTEQVEAVHAFPEGGAHSVSLRVVDDLEAMSLPYSLKIYVNRSPAAAFQVSNFSPDEGEEVKFTDCSSDLDPEGEIASWQWEFGDGESSDLLSPSHAYQVDGSYTVTLTVTDANGAEGKAKAEVTVSNLAPVAKLTANGKAGELDVPTGGTIQFDASNSEDQSPNGQIVRYEWDLDGDGSVDECTTVSSLVHSYSDDGVYAVTLRVIDDDGATALADPITVQVYNRVPECTFGWLPEVPTDAEEVTFRATGSDPDGEIISWSWAFGDGSTADVQNPVHHFADDGTYPITLTVGDDDGAEGSCTAEITVKNALPIAAFSFSPSLPQVGEAVRFIDRSEDPSPAGRIVHVAWSFGDGTSCPGTPAGCEVGGVHSPTHRYNAPGTYTIILVVIDGEGALDRTTRTLIVSE